MGKITGFIELERIEEVALPAAAELGEHPFWDERERALVWVDVLSGRVHRLTPGAGDAVAVDLGVAVGAAAPVEGGGFVLAAADWFRPAVRKEPGWSGGSRSCHRRRVPP